MTSKMKTLIAVVVFAAFLVAAYFGYNALLKVVKPDTNITTAAGDKIAAPDFVVYDAAGNEVRLSDFKGQPVVLNFWASWCPPCKAEMPHFNTVYADVKDSVVFLMVDLVDGQRETQQLGQAYVDEQGFSFPIYFDLKQSAANAYGISSIPTTIFIDADGNIVTGQEGQMDEQTLRKGIDLIK